MVINWLKVGMVAASIAAIAYGAYILKERGAESERAKVEKENLNAGTNAEKYRSKLHDCLESGGMYDFYTGKCSGAKTRLRILPSWFNGEDNSRPKQD